MDLIDKQLQKAEDTLVYIPASAIQECIRKLAESLNEVKRPKLCLPSTQMSIRSIPRDAGSKARSESPRTSSPLADGPEYVVNDILSQNSITNDSLILGDLFFAPAFCRPSSAFLLGLGDDLASQLRNARDPGLAARLSMYVSHSYSFLFLCSDMVPFHSRYKAYHAVSSLLQHYSDRASIDDFCNTNTIMSQEEDEQIEMEARELLTEALNEMASLCGT